MTATNKELMTQAREALQGKWGMAVGAFFIYMMIVTIVSMFGTGWDLITGAFTEGSLSQFSPVSTGLSILIGAPFTLGVSIFTLSIARGSEDAKMEQIFDGFKSFIKALITYFVMNLFIILWALLLIIPGIIASLAYSMTFYILADEPDINPIDAIRRSREMMYGYKWKFFCLNLRFLGWAILCLFTMGIGYLWLLPYIYVSFAKFYEEVKANPISKEE